MARPRSRNSGTVCLHNTRWYFRFYDYSGRRPIRRSVPLGTLQDLPTRDDAKAAAQYYCVHRPSNIAELAKARHFGRDRIPLNLAWFNAKFQEQKGCCAICGAMPKRLVVDHDHNDGQLRGLLCSTCNTGMGMFRDSAVHLLAAVAYLKRYGNT